ncbi:hypothetical protein Btru_026241 [Bulinus truncatus]|nr:hypothetical protein Btru_026241 [Bulinus truncatus]
MILFIVFIFSLVTETYCDLPVDTLLSSNSNGTTTTAPFLFHNTTKSVDRVYSYPEISKPGKGVKVDAAGTCAQFLSADPSIRNKISSLPMCTLRGVIFDELTKFIVEQFDYHTCMQHKFAQILYCSIVTNHQICLQAVGKVFDIEAIPTFSAVYKTIRKLCFLHPVLPKDCMFQHFKAVENCIMEDVKSELEINSRKFSYGNIYVCRHYEIKKLCMWEELKPCGDKTASLLASVIGVLMKPPACIKVKENKHLKNSIFI